MSRSFSRGWSMHWQVWSWSRRRRRAAGRRTRRAAAALPASLSIQHLQVEVLEQRVLLSGSIAGVAWSDVNGDGFKNFGEPELADVVVYLDGNDSGSLDWTDGNGNKVWDAGEGEQWTVTDGAGAYTLAGLGAGPQIVRQIAPAGYVQTSPVGGAAETFKLTASDAAAFDTFGNSVAISGGIVIVGANLDDDAGVNSGSAYLFDTATATENFKLTASDAAAGDDFGVSVAIGGNAAIVGAASDDDAGMSSGSAYVFSVVTGQELFKLTAADAAAGDFFGVSVAISGNTAIVGARGDDDGGNNSGSAYLFDVTTGQQLFKLAAADAAEGDEFGWSVAISGNIAIVGAYGNDDGGSDSGSAYLFDVTTGQQLFKLTATDAAPDAYFGLSVAISGNIAIVGAQGDAVAGTNSGSVYVFDVTTGQQVRKLTATDAAAGDIFGSAVAISGNIAIVGAYEDDDAGSISGSAYVFNVTSGEQLAKLTASDGAAQDAFGFAVAFDGRTAIIGANDVAGSDSGSAYLFTITTDAHRLTLAADENLTGQDFGSLWTPASIRGNKWLDTEGDGIRGESEDPVPGVVIFLDEDLDGVLDWADGNGNYLWDDGEGERWTLTDANGDYLFDNLLPGDYVVREVTPEGYRLTSPINSIERVSMGVEGTEANGFSSGASISGDGRYVAFASYASNLVPNDDNDASDVFVYDRLTGQIERVSVPEVWQSGAGGGEHPSISADGRFVAFQSYSSTLVPGDSNGQPDVFLYDRLTHTLRRISMGLSETEANSGSEAPSISANGRYVVFQSYASNLVSGDNNGVADIFVYDVVQDTVERVSWTDHGLEANGTSAEPAISGDGRFVVYESDATNLVDGEIDPDTNGQRDIFIYDRDSGAVERVSRGNGGVEGDAYSFGPRVSDDGRYVVYASDATNLVTGDTNGVRDVFLYDRDTQQVRRLSVSSDGVQGYGGSFRPSISADGRLVAFHSSAPTLTPWDGNGSFDVFVYDTAEDRIHRVSRGVSSVMGDGDSIDAAISANGRFVAFSSYAANLVDGDTNQMADIFAVDRHGRGGYAVSVATGADISELDFGNQWILGSIVGVKYEDSDGNGVQDGGELPLQGVVIFLDADDDGLLDWTDGNSNGAWDAGEGERWTVTLADGSYMFADLEPGSYRVREVIQPGYSPILPDVGNPADLALISRDSEGVPGGGDSHSPSLSVSDDGVVYVAFVSAASDLVPDDTNEYEDVFLKNTQTGAITRISVGLDSVQADGPSYNPVISADGRFVVFESDATNLVEDDTNYARDVFVYDVFGGWIERVSVAANGSQAYGGSFDAVISGDGRYVAFVSDDAYIFGGSSGYSDVFVKDRQTGLLQLVSVPRDYQADGVSDTPSISYDGRFVAFQSVATNLVPGDTNDASDVFLFDRQSSTVSRVSVATGGAQGNGSSGNPAISGDGRFVAFESFATNLVAGDSNAASDIFVRDVGADETVRMSIGAGGAESNGGSSNPSLSGDGRYLAFESDATNLVSGDTNGVTDVFFFDRFTGVTARASVAADGTEGDQDSGDPTLSGDGRFVVFQSGATTLVSGDYNESADVFLFDRGGDGAHFVTLYEGSAVTGIHFANQWQPTTISGSKWIDANGDGVRDIDEDPQQGVTIYLDRNGNGQLDWTDANSDNEWQEDEGERWTVTDEFGDYFFDELVPGTYIVREVTGTGFGVTAPTDQFRLIGATLPTDAISPYSLFELSGDPLAASFIAANPPAYFSGLDYDPATQFLYGSFGTILRRIESVTGGTDTILGTVRDGASTPILMYDIAFDPSGNLYAYSTTGGNPSLYTIDISTLTATLVGVIGQSLASIEFGPDGTLYGANSGLYIIDPATAQITSTVGSLGGMSQGLDFAPDGSLYRVSTWANVPFSQIDPVTLARTDFGFLDYTFISIASIPVPGAHIVTVGLNDNVTGRDFGNYNPPPVIENQDFSIRESEAVSTVVGNLAATDQFSDPLTFNITSGNDANLFSIDPDTGVITLAAALDYGAATSHVLTVNVVDSNGGMDDATITINVIDDPVADAGGPYTITEGDPLALSAAVSDFTSGADLTYAWDLDNDGQFDDASGQTPTVPWATLSGLGLEPGVHTIAVEITTSDGGMGTDTTTLTIQQPTGSISGSKWYDTNADGVWDPDEDPVAGVTIYLDDNGNGTLDWTDGNSNSVWDAGEGEQWTITDEFGDYFFSDLVAGSYSVREILGAGLRQTSPGNAFRFIAGTAPTDLTYPGMLLELSPQDGSVAVVSDPAPPFVVSMDVNPGTGVLYASYSAFLFAVDSIHGGSDVNLGQVRDSSDVALSLGAIAFDPNGVLYGYANPGFPSLYTIDLGTLRATLATPLSGPVTSMEFGSDGTLYAATSLLYTVNLATGALSAPLGPLNGPGPGYGLDFAPDGLLYRTSFTGTTPIAFASITPAPFDCTDLVTFDHLLNALASVPAAASHDVELEPGQNATGLDFGNVNPAPIIENRSLSVPENASPSALVGSVNAIDQYGDTFTYAITAGNDAGRFAINPTTGQITVAGALDHETAPSHLLTVEVEDSNGGVSSASITIDVTNVNEPPTAEAGGPYTIDEGQDLPLDGSGSDPDAGTTLTYNWDLDNDGQYDDAIGATPTVPWTTLAGLGLASDGSGLTIGVQISDGMGGVTTDTATLTITNLNPAAAAGPGYTIGEGEDLTLAGSATDPGGDALTYAWDLDNDGAYDDATGNAPTVPWATLVSLGLGVASHTIALEVSDGQGGTDTSSTSLDIQQAQGSISGSKWRDDNADGVKDTGEPVLEGVTIYLDANDNGTLDWTDANSDSEWQEGEGERGTVTDASGEYLFDHLLPGDHIVREVVPTGYAQTAPGEIEFFDDFNSGPSPAWSNDRGDWQGIGLQYDATTPGGGLTRTVLPYVLRDFEVEVDIQNVQDGGIWLRSPDDRNGILLVTGGNSGTGTGLYWHIVEDTTSGGQPVLNEVTGLFTSGESDPHLRIRVVGNEFSVFVDGSQTPTATFTSDRFQSGQVGLYDNSGQTFDNFLVRSIDDRGYRVTLTVDQQVTGKDFGNQALPSSISGSKWRDDNGDGVWDVGEPGLADVTIFLDGNDNGTLDWTDLSEDGLWDEGEGERWTTTDVAGDYLFDNLLPGDYIVREVVPSGYRPTYPTSLAEVQVLTAYDGGNEFRFGGAVAASDAYLLVGAPNHDYNGEFSGAAYLFDGTDGSLLFRLLPDDGAASDNFGQSVAISGDYLIIGSPWAGGTGAAYVFDAVTGQQLFKLTADDAGGDSQLFGMAVAAYGDLVVIGAPEDSNANGSDAGAAYVFDLTTGTQVRKLLPTGGASNDDFGMAVAIGGTHVLVGAQRHDGNQQDSGAAYVFDLATGNQVTALSDVSGGINDWFGASVALDSSTAIVGSPRDDTAGGDRGSVFVFNALTGVQLDWYLPDNPLFSGEFGSALAARDGLVLVGARTAYVGGPDAGAGYLFDLATGTQQYQLIADNASSYDYLGQSAALSGRYAFLGAPGSDLVASNAGAVYQYDLMAADPHAVTLGPDQQVIDQDFGNQPLPSSISGEKWSDANGDGIYDDGEELLADVVIYLDSNASAQLDWTDGNGNSLWDEGEGERWTVTDIFGQYIFDNLLPGDYTVREQVPTGYQQTYPIPGEGGAYVVALGAGDSAIDIDFANQNPAPTIDNQGFSVAEDAYPSTIIGSVAASDQFGDTFTYQITAGNPGGLFNLDSSYGTLTLLGALDYETAASYDLTVRATDSVGQMDFATITVTMTDVNETPTADAGGPYTISVGQGLPLDGSGSTDPDVGDTLTYAWDLDNDGQFDDASGATPTVPWATLSSLGLTPGSPLPVGLRVMDNGEFVDFDFTTLTIQPVAPVAPIAEAGGPYVINEGQGLLLAGSATNPGGGLLTYLWDLDNDGQFDDASGATPTVPWSALAGLGLPSNGTARTIHVRVDGGAAGFSTDTATLTITNLAPVASAGGPYTINEGQGLLLTGSGTDAGGDALSYAWDLDNDGQFDDATSATPSVPWSALVGMGLPSDGTARTVQLQVTDSDGASHTAGTTLTIRNLPPVAIPGGPYIIGEGADLVLAGAGSDPGNDGLTYAWDLNNDGVYGDVTGATPTVPWSTLTGLGFTGIGATTTIRLRVDDSQGGFHAGSTTLTVQNLAPTGNPGGRYDINEGQPLLLSGSATDPGGDVLSYQWDLDGDGQFDDASGASPAVPWAALALLGLPSNGSDRTIALRVSDHQGGVHISQTALAVHNLDPSGDAGGPYTITEGQPLLLAGSATDPGGDTLSYQWDLDGDGQFDDASGADPTVSWNVLALLGLPSDGTTVTIGMQVSDSQGGSSIRSADLTILNADPTAAAGSYTINEGGILLLAGLGSDPGGDPLTYVWDLNNDGAFETPGATPTVPWEALQLLGLPHDGSTVPIRLQVTDGEGGSASSVGSLTILNLPPTANPGGPYIIDEGQGVTLAGSGSDPVDPTVTFAWDLNGDGVFGDAVGATPALTWAQLLSFGLAPASVPYTIRLRTDDGQNGTTTAATTLTVNNIDGFAEAGGPYVINEGQGLTLSGFSRSSAPRTVAWDLDGDGQFDDAGTGTVVLTWEQLLGLGFRSDSVARPVAFRVAITGGSVDIDSALVTITNLPPAANAGGPYTLLEDQTVTLAGSGTDPGGDPLTYTWDLDGDGQFDDASGAAPTLDWNAMLDLGLLVGPNTITLRVDDGQGGQRTATATLEVVAVTGSIAGVKWEDTDGDGGQDVDEPGLAGVTIYLDANDNHHLDWTDHNGNSQWDDGEGERWTVTTDDGSYLFDKLEPGDYLIREIVPDNYTQVFPGLVTPTQLVSIGVGPTFADAASQNPAMTADGRFIAFESMASNLAPGDANGLSDIFVYDRLSGALQRVSVASTGGDPDGSSFRPALSQNSRYVAFASDATNLVADDSNGLFDIFVYDRFTDTTRRVSLGLDGAEADGPSWAPSISADGRYIAFQSNATNLVPGDTNRVSDIFVYDRLTGTTRRVSVTGSGAQANGASTEPSLSFSGSLIAFQSKASNLVAGDTNNESDIFWMNLASGEVRLVSRGLGGTAANDSSTRPRISGNGAVVAFQSTASNLGADDINNVSDVFVFDVGPGTMQRVSVSDEGVGGNRSSRSVIIGPAGRFVGFISDANNLVTGDNNGVADAFLFDRQTGQIERSVTTADGSPADGGASAVAVDAFGHFVLVASSASNIITGDSNGVTDLFLFDRASSGAQTAFVVAGETADSVDFGNLPITTATLGDFVFVDQNADGVQNHGETGLDGVTVTLFDASGAGPVQVASRVTAEGGYYSFIDIAPGSYVVQFELPAGYLFAPANVGGDHADSDADPDTGFTGVVTLVAGDNVDHVDAGIFRISPAGTAAVQRIGASEALADADVLLTRVQIEETAPDTVFAAINDEGLLLALRDDGATGAHYVQFTVLDLPGGGAAEVLFSDPRVQVQPFDDGLYSGYDTYLPYDWQLGVDYQLAIELTREPGRTSFDAMFFDPALPEQGWLRIASIALPDQNVVFSRFDSFVEDLGVTFQQRRSMLVGNSWIHGSDGTWQNLTDGQFVASGEHANVDGDVAGAYWRLESGGATVGDTPNFASLVVDVVPVFETFNPAPQIEDQGATVPENLAAGSALGVIIASDTFNDTLTYAITDGNDAGLFTLDAATGVLSLAAGRTLDYETATQHVLTVTVTDTGGSVAAALVVVTVTDVPETVPGDIPAVAAPLWFLDVDQDGRADAMTDGILIQRYLAGRRGDALVAQGPFGAGARRTDAGAIADYLATDVGDQLDIDGDGRVDAATDGRLILRYLLGFTGSALIAPDVASGTPTVDPAATRGDAEGIAAYLRRHDPAAPQPAPQAVPALAVLAPAVPAAVAAWQQQQASVKVVMADSAQPATPGLLSRLGTLDNDANRVRLLLLEVDGE